MLIEMCMRSTKSKILVSTEFWEPLFPKSDHVLNTFDMVNIWMGLWHVLYSDITLIPVEVKY